MVQVSPIGIVARNTGIQYGALVQVARNEDGLVGSALTGVGGGDLTPFAQAAAVYSIARDSIPFWIQTIRDFLTQLKSFNPLAFGGSK